MRVAVPRWISVECCPSLSLAGSSGTGCSDAVLTESASTRGGCGSEQARDGDALCMQSRRCGSQCLAGSALSAVRPCHLPALPALGARMRCLQSLQAREAAVEVSKRVMAMRVACSRTTHVGTRGGHLPSGGSGLSRHVGARGGHLPSGRGVASLATSARVAAICPLGGEWPLSPRRRAWRPSALWEGSGLSRHVGARGGHLPSGRGVASLATSARVAAICPLGGEWPLSPRRRAWRPSPSRGVAFSLARWVAFARSQSLHTE